MEDSSIHGPGSDGEREGEQFGLNLAHQMANQGRNFPYRQPYTTAEQQKPLTVPSYGADRMFNNNFNRTASVTYDLYHRAECFQQLPYYSGVTMAYPSKGVLLQPVSGQADPLNTDSTLVDHMNTPSSDQPINATVKSEIISPDSSNAAYKNIEFDRNRTNPLSLEVMKNSPSFALQTKTSDQTGSKDILTVPTAATYASYDIDLPQQTNQCEETEESDRYMCGSCFSTFSKICQLHYHLKIHNDGGSYFFNHHVNTAYLKVSTACIETQTEEWLDVPSRADEVETTGPSDSDAGSEIPKEKKINDKTPINITITRKKEKPKVTDTNNENNGSIKSDDDSHVEMNDPEHLTVANDNAAANDNDESSNSTESPRKQRNKRKSPEKVAKEQTKSGRSKARNKRNEDYCMKLELSDDGSEVEVEHDGNSDDDDDYIESMEESFDSDEYEVEATVDNKKSEKKPQTDKPKKPRAKLYEEYYVIQDDKKFQCKLCDNSYEEYRKFSNHCSKFHPEITNRKKKITSHRKPMECMWCGESLPNTKRCTEHMQQCEFNQRLICQICDQRFSSRTELNDHILTHQGQDMSCKKCTKAFTNIIFYHNHLLRHAERKHVQCEHCGKYVNGGRTLVTHLRECNKELTIPCPQCDKMFKTQRALKFHLAVHSDDRPFVCHICGCAVKKASYLKRHIRSHTGEKPYACPECGLCFSALNGLNRHRRIHTNNKPCVCHFCGKSFTTNWNLKTHLRQHTGDTPYQCSLCGKAFKQNVLLKLHNKSHHPNIKTIDE